ncbi:MAG: hypothetical protein NE328_23450 [Lentisphaeraceae bacterium]|nr:hypothetical protein [Lentisphaeraceae bacterium]
MASFNSVSEARQHHLKVKRKINEMTKCELGDPKEEPPKESIWGAPLKVVSSLKTKIELKKLKKELDESEHYLVSAKTAAIDKDQFDDTIEPDDDYRK